MHFPTEEVATLSKPFSGSSLQRYLCNTTKVAGGSYSAEAIAGWDMLLVSTDFGEGSLLENGCPRTVREWRRGTPLRDARLVYEGVCAKAHLLRTGDFPGGLDSVKGENDGAWNQGFS